MPQRLDYFLAHHLGVAEQHHRLVDAEHVVGADVDVCVALGPERNALRMLSFSIASVTAAAV